MKIVVSNVNASSPTELDVTLSIEDFKSAATAAELEQVLATALASKQKLNVFSLLLLLGGLFGNKY